MITVSMRGYNMTLFANAESVFFYDKNDFSSGRLWY